MGGVGRVTCQGFLVREVCISVLVGGAGFLWSAMKCPVVSFEISVGLVWLWAACISKLRAMFLHCWRLCMVCLALGLVGSLVVLGFSVSMQAFG